MSAECIKVKQEPGLEAENDEENDCNLKPEFICIKNEAVDIPADIPQISIKKELLNEEPDFPSPWPQAESQSSWHCPIVKIEVDPDPQQIEITIKPEPVYDIIPFGSETNGHLLIARTSEPKTLATDVTEEALNQHATTNGKYMCPICHKRFANKGNVQRHIALHSRQKLECTICTKTFLRKEKLDEHIAKIHNNSRIYKCEECEKCFKTTSNLLQHKRVHLTVKPFTCETCHRSFAIKANLAKHQGTSRCKQQINEPIVCKICDKVFQKEFLLKSHLRRHATDKPFSCDICDMSFKYKSTLIRHIQLHNGIKPYSCKICTKTFTHAGLIKPHMRIHTGEKPYPCPICKKMFAHKHNMQRHTLRHNKIKHLVCEVCHKKFPKESRLKYHMRTHTNEKPFCCQICPKKFTHKQNIQRHYTKKHPDATYDCPDTDASIAKVVWESMVKKKEVQECLEYEEIFGMN